MPSTETSISRPRMARSTTIFCANSAAKSIAAASSLASCALVMPTELPSVAGLTNTGKRNFLRIARSTLARRLLPLRNAESRGNRRPATWPAEQVASACLCPCRPPSPARPSRRTEARQVRAGPAPCRPRRTCRAAREKRRPRAAHRARRVSTGTRAATFGSAVSVTRSPVVQHFRQHLLRRRAGEPSAVLRDADRHDFILLGQRADHRCRRFSDTSCSPERPPNSTPTRNRFFPSS